MLAFCLGPPAICSVRASEPRGIARFDRLPAARASASVTWSRSGPGGKRGLGYSAGLSLNVAAQAAAAVTPPAYVPPAAPAAAVAAPAAAAAVVVPTLGILRTEERAQIRRAKVGISLLALMLLPLPSVQEGPQGTVLSSAASGTHACIP